MKAVLSGLNAWISAEDKPQYFKSMVIGLAVVLIALGGFTAWAGFVPLAEGSYVEGRLVVASSRQSIEHLRGGIVAEIHVSDGDRVVRDQPLVSLDTTEAAHSVRVVNSRFLRSQATIARLQAEQRGDREIVWPEELLADTTPFATELKATQLSLLNQNLDQLDNELAILRERNNQFLEQIRGNEAQQNANRQETDLIEEELVGLRDLYERGYAPKTRVLALERRKANLEGERGRLIADVARLREAISENELEIVNIQKAFRRQVLQQLEEELARLDELSSQLVTVREQAKRTIVRAPISGIVVDRQVHTVGGVVRPGGRLMDIVPEDEGFKISARVLPIDIDSIVVGMQAEIRLAGLPQRSAPILDGVVTKVSADIVEEPAPSGAAYYPVTVELHDGQIERVEADNLTPGMPAQVMVKSGERTFLAYIAGPWGELMRRAMTE